MNDAERMAVIEGCRFVDEIVPHVPYVMNDEVGPERFEPPPAFRLHARRVPPLRAVWWREAGRSSWIPPAPALPACESCESLPRQYVRWMMKTYRIDYVVHGDDPCIVDGKDVYAS